MYSPVFKGSIQSPPYQNSQWHQDMLMVYTCINIGLCINFFLDQFSRGVDVGYMKKKLYSNRTAIKGGPKISPILMKYTMGELESNIIWLDFKCISCK